MRPAREAYLKPAASSRPIRCVRDADRAALLGLPWVCKVARAQAPAGGNTIAESGAGHPRIGAQ